MGCDGDEEDQSSRSPMLLLDSACGLGCTWTGAAFYCYYCAATRYALTSGFSYSVVGVNAVF
jgi:hypothetical protein